MKRVFAAVVLAAATASAAIGLGACSGGGQPASSSGATLSVAMIPKGTTHNSRTMEHYRRVGISYVQNLFGGSLLQFLPVR